jgi:hypothetical protein
MRLRREVHIENRADSSGENMEGAFCKYGVETSLPNKARLMATDTLSLLSVQL